MTIDASPLETPSGKDVAYENFPVGSWLLPARTRPCVAAFYAFARAADDIADNADLDADDKVARLDGFEAALLGLGDDSLHPKAAGARRALAAAGVGVRHGVDLLAAFKRDARQTRYRDWDDLRGYCALSASPVGRFLLDLHGGAEDGYESSDALCDALQVINHMQDCGDDFRALDRVYLPLDWFAAEGAEVAELGAAAATPALRRVLDRTLEATRALMAAAHPLPRRLRDRRLAMEAAGIIRIADALLDRLARLDPLAVRVRLPKWRYAVACAGGVLAGLSPVGRR